MSINIYGIIDNEIDKHWDKNKEILVQRGFKDKLEFMEGMSRYLHIKNAIDDILDKWNSEDNNAKM